MRAKTDLPVLRHQMVADQILQRGISDPRILDAMEAIPRHMFVPYTRPKDAYGDGPLPIGQGQTISQPYITAYMTELLSVQSKHKVLEVGTGSGYQAALLSILVSQVFTIEIVATHYVRARKVLELLHLDNIRIRLGNGREGWPEEAPFDRIIVTAAGKEAPQALLKQLKNGGRLIMPVGFSALEQHLRIYRRNNNQIIRQDDLPVRFVPLVEGN